MHIRLRNHSRIILSSFALILCCLISLLVTATAFITTTITSSPSLMSRRSAWAPSLGTMPSIRDSHSPIRRWIRLQQPEAMGSASNNADPPRSLRAEAFQEALALYNRMRNDDEDTYMGGKLKAALDVVEQAIRLYGPDKVFGSYNGGKDAVVVMHLLRAALANYVQQQHRNKDTTDSLTLLVPRPRLIFFAQPREFPEVMALVRDTTEKYDLDLLVYENMSFVEGLQSCVDAEGGVPLAFLLGTRKGDPNCKEQETFAPSSTWMPAFMRVNPILDWGYGHIWHFLRRYELPYCGLYDEGYTSLGNVDDTLPNPALALPGGGGYRPAYLLSDWSLERAGRVDKKKKKKEEEEGKEEDSTTTKEEELAVSISEDRLECELRDLEQNRRKAQNAKTAGLIIIGDEILKGKTSDTNSLYAARRLREKGIQVKRISVLSDDHDEIMAEVRDQVQRFDVVITSGGVGPTHDDITIKAVAAALGQGVRENEDMIQKLQEAYGLGSPEELTDGQKKMALLPDLARLRAAPNTASTQWPILQCENVFILPGVPQFFESKMDTIATHFLGQRPLFTRQIALCIEEVHIVQPLNEAVSRFQREVIFGSYPFYGEVRPRVIITLESSDETEVDAAKEFLLERIPSDVVLAVTNDDNMATTTSPSSQSKRK